MQPQHLQNHGASRDARVRIERKLGGGSTRPHKGEKLPTFARGTDVLRLASIRPRGLGAVLDLHRGHDLVGDAESAGASEHGAAGGTNRRLEHEIGERERAESWCGRRPSFEFVIRIVQRRSAIRMGLRMGPNFSISSRRRPLAFTGTSRAAFAWPAGFVWARSIISTRRMRRRRNLFPAWRGR
jgi:hypothetical protein